MKNEIEYSEIDLEIRTIVQLINGMDEVSTLYSCAGHQLGEQGYVTFKVESQTAIEKLLSMLPEQWCLKGFHENQPYAKFIWMNTELMIGHGIVYSLRFQGFPFYKHRELLEDIEKSIIYKINDYGILR